MINQSRIIFQNNKFGIGKRKEAIARVFLIPGTGNIFINKMDNDNNFQNYDYYLKE